MIYETARYANPEHTIVEGADALGNTETVPTAYALFRQPEHGPQGFIAAGGVIAVYVEPEATAPSVPTLCCLANLHVEAGEVSGVETATGLSFAFMVEVDKIWVLFSEPMKNTAYGWNANSTVGNANVSDRQLEYLEITATNTTEPFDISLQIFALS